jgi:diguanylate cyclase (GGDEF)-like protein
VIGPSPKNFHALRHLLPVLCLILSLPSRGQVPATAFNLTSLSQIRQTASQMGEYGRREVALPGVVAFYAAAGNILFGADSTNSISVHTSRRFSIHKVDLGQISGVVIVGDDQKAIDSSDVRVAGHGVLPQPRPATLPELMSGKHDRKYVTVTGTLRAITLQQSPDGPFLFLEVLMDGGYTAVQLERPEGLESRALLDPSVTLTGVFASAFDGKFESAGSVVYVNSPRDVRVTGVSFVQAGAPGHSPYAFDLSMRQPSAVRQPSDVVALALPSWRTQGHLLFLISGLGCGVFAALLWGAILSGRMHTQTNLLRRTLEEDAARERYQAFIERERARVLEAINSLMPLEQVLRMIANLISEQMYGLCCWCLLPDGATIGCSNAHGIDPPRDDMPQTRRDIHSRNGERLSVFILDSNHRPEDPLVGEELLDLAVSLAALAIDNRQLYEGLIHRSEYDQLTEVPNRFLLESRLTDALDNAGRHHHGLALIYIDLDEFKMVNDRCGHRIGDLYLQHVAIRLTERLRSRDTLARVGGDEFIALIPRVRDRNEAQEIAHRLQGCFDSPFRIDDLTLCGSASIGVALYPSDGKDADQLKRFADAAMYASKQQEDRELELEF